MWGSSIFSFPAEEKQRLLTAEDAETTQVLFSLNVKAIARACHAASEPKLFPRRTLPSPAVKSFPKYTELR
jgi:hypothetical protein